jgi:hypothetical protein
VLVLGLSGVGVDYMNYVDCSSVPPVLDTLINQDADKVLKQEMMEMNFSADLDLRLGESESVVLPLDYYEDEQMVVLEVVVEASVFVICCDDLDWTRQ